MLRERSQAEKENTHNVPYPWSLKNKRNEHTSQNGNRAIDTENKQVFAGRETGVGEERNRRGRPAGVKFQSPVDCHRWEMYRRGI